jgi:hypothetical protein
MYRQVTAAGTAITAIDRPACLTILSKPPTGKFVDMIVLFQRLQGSDFLPFGKMVMLKPRAI